MKPDVALPKNLMFGVKLILSPEHLAKLLVVQLADLQQAERKLSNYYVSVRDLIFSPIQFHLRLLELESGCSK